MDIQTLTLTGLVAIGAVNVLAFFKPELDSRVKFAVSALVAFGVGFIPQEIGVMLLDHAKDAILAAFAASGTYKLAMKVGGQ